MKERTVDTVWFFLGVYSKTLYIEKLVRIRWQREVISIVQWPEIGMGDDDSASAISDKAKRRP